MTTTRAVGILFVFLCPFVGGPLVIASVASVWVGHDAALMGFAVWTVVWVLMYCLWFDGSKYQRSI